MRDQMPRCETCRHYTPPDDDDRKYDLEAPDFGRCARIPHSRERRADDLALAEDVEGYSACLRVGPDFGCVMHEGVDGER